MHLPVGWPDDSGEAASSVYAAVIPAPFGCVGLRIHQEQISGIDFLPRATAPRAPNTPVAHRAVTMIAAYLQDPKTQFDLPIKLAGSLFRQRVWQAVAAIPLGQTRTYGELAEAVGSSARAVGQAVGDNPLPIIVPCHRVVGKRDLGGFMHQPTGYGVEIKRWLLRHEGVLE